MPQAFAPAPVRRRPAVAGVLGWSLLLSGWIGFGRLGGAQGPDPAWIVVVSAAWWICLGLAARGPGERRGGSPAAWLVGASVLGLLSLRGVPVSLLCWVAGWAWLTMASLAAAGAATRVQRADAAALGALLAWSCVGDADLGTLPWRMAGLGSLAAAALLLAPAVRPAAAPLRHCAALAWPFTGRSRRRDWPVEISATLMLPMMCGLAWMASLCAGEGLAMRAMVGWHLAAMFVPAWLVSRSEALVAKAPQLCGALLGAAALAAFLAPRGPFSWACVGAAGSAWSVAWAFRAGRAAPLRRRLLD